MTVRHRLAAIWFADLVDYSRLSATDQAGAMRLVARFQDAARAAVGAYGGRVVKFLGDGALAEFPSTEQAVRSADALRSDFARGGHHLRRRHRPDGPRLIRCAHANPSPAPTATGSMGARRRAHCVHRPSNAPRRASTNVHPFTPR